MKTSKEDIVIIIVGAILFLGIFYGISQHRFTKPVQVVIEAKVATQDMYQLFYDAGKGFNEVDSLRVTAMPGDKFQQIVFDLPFLPITIHSFRIDTGSVTKKIDIKQISVKTVNQTLSWGPQEILNEFSSYVDFSTKEIVNNNLHLETSGNDPQFAYKGDLSKTVDLNDVFNNSKKVWYLVIFSVLYLTIFIFLFSSRKKLAKK